MDGSMDNAIPYQELEQRRAKVLAARQAPKEEEPPFETDSEAMQLIHEILNPSLKKIPKSKGPYTMPEEVKAEDVGVEDVVKDLDIRKLAELKEVFSLFDTDCDGLITKDDLRFTFMMLGGESEEEIIEEMLKEAKDPLDYDAFVELMSLRTIELDPEDVLLEAWAKWDEWGTGKIDEKNCSQNIQIFPYLRELVIENSTEPEYVICNRSDSANGIQMSITHDAAYLTDNDEIIFSSGKILGLRVQSENTFLFPLNVTAEYRFLKKEHFHNDGRLIDGTYCDYYFFANVDISLDIWQYFHSPRFPAKYPAHIKCAYKFLGRPENIVEIVFEEIKLPQHNNSCKLDTLTIFDAESANMNDVIDVISWRNIKKRILSTGSDLLIEFNASSNMTAKGFRGRFRFLNFVQNFSNVSSSASTDECNEIYDSRLNKTGKFETARILANTATTAVISELVNSSINCRFEFYGNTSERIQIKFLDFNLPTMHENSNECSALNSLQLLKKVRGKYEIDEMFCGVFLPKPIMSSDSKMVLQFVGQLPKSGNKYKFYGFKAEYHFITNFGITSGRQLNNSCNFAYNSTDRKMGTFTSPNFPGLYPKNMTCNYYFYGEPNEKVIINMTYFDVEGVGDCEFSTASDYVELSNFMTVDRKFSKYCGKFTNKFQIQSDGNFFRVSFYSNDRFDKTGFRAFYQFYQFEIIKPRIMTNVSEKSFLYSQANHAILTNAIQWSLVILSSTAMLLTTFKFHFCNKSSLSLF